MATAVATKTASDDEGEITSYFEVHVRREDRWVIDCTTQSGEDAIAEAEEIARKSDVLAVKVINERYNAETDESAARVVYSWLRPTRNGKGGNAKLAAAMQPRAAAPTVSTGAEGSGRRPTMPRKAPQQSPNASPPWMILVWASLALATAGTLLFVVLSFAG